jgi:hypothetical protein
MACPDLSNRHMLVVRPKHSCSTTFSYGARLELHRWTEGQVQSKGVPKPRPHEQQRTKSVRRLQRLPSRAHLRQTWVIVAPQTRRRLCGTFCCPGHCGGRAHAWRRRRHYRAHRRGRRHCGGRAHASAVAAATAAAAPTPGAAGGTTAPSAVAATTVTATPTPGAAGVTAAPTLYAGVNEPAVFLHGAGGASSSSSSSSSSIVLSSPGLSSEAPVGAAARVGTEVTLLPALTRSTPIPVARWR